MRCMRHKRQAFRLWRVHHVDGTPRLAEMALPSVQREWQGAQLRCARSQPLATPETLARVAGTKGTGIVACACQDKVNNTNGRCPSL